MPPATATNAIVAKPASPTVKIRCSLDSSRASRTRSRIACRISRASSAVTSGRSMRVLSTPMANSMWFCTLCESPDWSSENALSPSIRIISDGLSVPM